MLSVFDRLIFVVVCFTCLMIICNGRTTSSKRVLVVLQDLELKKSHSLFFEDLKANGFSLTFKKHDDSTLALIRYGEYQFDNLILFAPRASTFGTKNSNREILDFVDSGRNILLVGSSKLSKRTIDLGLELGTDFEPTGSMVYDHINYAKIASKESDGPFHKDHSLLVVEPESQIRDLFNKRKRSAPNRPLLFRGVGQSISSESEHHLIAVSGTATSYSYCPNHDPNNEDEALVGKDTSLVTLMQTTNNGRAAIVGSLEFFGNKFFNVSFKAARNQQEYEKSGNQEFCEDLALWTFQLIGVLQPGRPQHYNTLTGVTPPMYTVMDHVHFELNISELIADQWVPYRSNNIRLDYHMMYPYIRTYLKDNGNGTFSLNLQAPDVYGVFKFLVKHQIPGYSNIDIVEMAPIRPFRHNEFERFILTAYPYYVSVFSLMTGFWIFGILFIYHK